LQLVGFMADHANAIIQGGLNDDRNMPPIQVSQFVEDMCNENASFTGVINDDLVACAGVYPVWDGLGEAWFLASHRIFENPITVSRAVRRGLEKIMDENNYHRVQAHVNGEWSNARRWAKLMGMEEEGVMKKFSPDKKDFIRFAKVI